MLLTKYNFGIFLFLYYHLFDSIDNSTRIIDTKEETKDNLGVQNLNYMYYK
jgi:hypothetical protein